MVSEHRHLPVRWTENCSFSQPSHGAKEKWSEAKREAGFLVTGTITGTKLGEKDFKIFPVNAAGCTWESDLGGKVLRRAAEGLRCRATRPMRRH